MPSILSDEDRKRSGAPVELLHDLSLIRLDPRAAERQSGWQVAEAERGRIPELPVFFITGYAGTALPPDVEVNGKPFELDVVACRVQAILEMGQQNSDNDLDP